MDRKAEFWKSFRGFLEKRSNSPDLLSIAMKDFQQSKLGRNKARGLHRHIDSREGLRIGHSIFREFYSIVDYQNIRK